MIAYPLIDVDLSIGRDHGYRDPFALYHAGSDYAGTAMAADRRAAGLTQRQLALMVDCRKSAVGAAERGRSELLPLVRGRARLVLAAVGSARRADGPVAPAGCWRCGACPGERHWSHCLIVRAALDSADQRQGGDA